MPTSSPAVPCAHPVESEPCAKGQHRETGRERERGRGRGRGRGRVKGLQDNRGVDWVLLKCAAAHKGNPFATGYHIIHIYAKNRQQLRLRSRRQPTATRSEGWQQEDALFAPWLLFICPAIVHTSLSTWSAECLPNGCERVAGGLGPRRVACGPAWVRLYLKDIHSLVV